MRTTVRLRTACNTMATSNRAIMMGTATAPKASQTCRDTVPLACSRNWSSGRLAPAGHGAEGQPPQKAATKPLPWASTAAV